MKSLHLEDVPMCLCVHIGVYMCSACTSHWSIRDTAVGMATRLWRGRSEVRIPARVHIGCAAFTLSYSVVPGLFPWCWSVILTTYLPLVSMLRMSGVLLYSSSYAFVACTGITWPSLDVYVYLHACAYRCVCVCVCVCVHERNVVQMVKLLVCVWEVPLSNLG